MTRPAASPARALVHDPFAGGWLAFEGRRTLSAARLDQVGPLLDEVAAAVGDGLWAVGFVSYDAAPALDPTLDAWPRADDGPPLAWWALCPPPRLASRLVSGPTEAPIELDWRPSVERAEHARGVERIRRLIARGDTYQVNYTFALEAAFAGDPEALFRHLWRAQQAPHSTFVDAGRWAVCSASPELFFQQQGDRLLARPMKGTARRGRFAAEDDELRRELRSVKNRAENVMITDMTRNDLGRLARPGSVVVERLFAEETYATVHQLISEVRAETSADPMAVLRTLFPCASITGAPKKRATEIIRALEKGPRGLYTGAVGFLAPGRRAQFSVAIRTAVVDRERRLARYGVGGGIVWDSQADAEYDECRAKALVLARPRPSFELLETLQWRPRAGFVRLDGHLQRLAASARHFGFRYRRTEVQRRLDELVQRFEAVRHRVRIRLGESGEVHVETTAWPCSGRETWRVVLDDRPVDEREPLLFHKTTERTIYEEALARHPGADEVILWNRHGRLTEGARSNLVLRFADAFFTPPLADGLLPGVYRQALLRRGRLREQPLDVASLDRADAIFCINSLRGWIRCEKIEELAASRASVASGRIVFGGLKGGDLDAEKIDGKKKALT